MRVERNALRKIEDVLVKEWHFDICMGIVKIDCIPQRPARHRHADAGGEIGCNIALKFVEQDEQFTIRRWEDEARLIEVNHSGAGSSERTHSSLERVEDGLWRRHIGVESVQACPSNTESRSLKTVRIQELRVIGGNIRGTGPARVLPSQGHASR